MAHIPPEASQPNQPAQKLGGEARSAGLTTQFPNLSNGRTGRFAQLFWAGLALMYAAIFGLTLVLAYTGNLPAWFQQIPLYDKVGHVVLYAIPTYLGHRLLRARSLRWLGVSWPLFPVLFGIFTIVEEASQGLSPNRTLDGMDLVCSFVGIGVGYWLAERK